MPASLTTAIVGWLRRAAPHDDDRGLLAGTASPVAAGVDPADLERAAGAARRVGGAGVRVASAGGVVAVAGPDLDAGAGAGAAIAALVDLGYLAARRPPRPGEEATVVVVGGRPAEPSDDRGR